MNLRVIIRHWLLKPSTAERAASDRRMKLYAEWGRNDALGARCDELWKDGQRRLVAAGLDINLEALRSESPPSVEGRPPASSDHGPAAGAPHDGARPC